MTPEAARYIDKARTCLSNASANLGIGLSNDAGRNAYLAAFHAAQALIFERSGKAATTHRGVQSEFNRLTAVEARFDLEFRAFLSQAYNLKAVADYETGPDSIIPIERSTTDLEKAKRCVQHIAVLLGETGTEPN